MRNLNLEELTPELLKKLFIEEELSDYLISQLYEVKKSKITYRRRKYGITIRNSILGELLLAKTDEAKKINEKYKNNLMINDNLTMISKAITHFSFRNGPIEDMHASPKNQLSQDDMKTLNKFMVNRIAYVFKLIIENRWFELDFLIKHTRYLKLIERQEKTNKESQTNNKPDWVSALYNNIGSTFML